MRLSDVVAADKARGETVAHLAVLGQHLVAELRVQRVGDARRPLDDDAEEAGKAPSVAASESDEGGEDERMVLTTAV